MARDRPANLVAKSITHVRACPGSEARRRQSTYAIQSMCTMTPSRTMCSAKRARFLVGSATVMPLQHVGHGRRRVLERFFIDVKRALNLHLGIAGLLPPVSGPWHRWAPSTGSATSLRFQPEKADARLGCRMKERPLTTASVPDDGRAPLAVEQVAAGTRPGFHTPGCAAAVNATGVIVFATPVHRRVLRCRTRSRRSSRKRLSRRGCRPCRCWPYKKSVGLWHRVS